MDQKQVEKDTIFLTLTGSRVYGTSNENSDWDYRGVCIPSNPIYYIGAGWRKFEHYEYPEGDKIIYDLRKFIKLAASGNPNILELLFIPSKYWVEAGPIWKELVKRRDWFLSKQVKGPFYGFATSQYKKIVKSENVNGKNLAHMVRLFNMVHELLADGELNVERPERDLLIDLRKNPWNVEQIKVWYNGRLGDINQAYKKTQLPEKPDLEKIDKLCEDIISGWVFGA